VRLPAAACGGVSRLPAPLLTTNLARQPRERHHRGPRRHPKDSHPPWVPERGASAPAAAPRSSSSRAPPATSAWA